MRGKRRKGIKLTTRIVKGAMKKHVLEVYGGQPQVQAFKASAGWMKRFMGRWRITWRRRNDNAKKSAAELMPAVTKFICRLREFRHDHPSALVGDLPPLPRWAETDPRHNFTATYGEFDPYNTLNVDQHPPTALRLNRPLHSRVHRHAACVDQTARVRSRQETVHAAAAGAAPGEAAVAVPALSWAAGADAGV
jgi:hypothetical protein